MKSKLLALFLLCCGPFVQAQIPTNGLLYNFKFDGTPTSEAGTNTFTSNSTISYTSNRFGNANRAIAKVYGQLISTNLTNLPTVNESRSVSVWIKPSEVNADNIIFTYGTGSGTQIYGASFNPTTVYNFTYSSNVSASSTMQVNGWKHVVVTYNTTNSQSSIYINGVLVNQGNIGLNTFATNFYLGSLLNNPTSSHFSGAYDDMLIYNRALTAAEVTLIYNDGIPPANVTVAEYNFNNTYNNINGNTPFSSNAGTSFVADRNGNAASALNIVNSGSTASIPNLPYGNAARTISFWAKVNTMQSPYNMTFSYGQSSTSNACGGSFRDTRVEFFGFANNTFGSSTNTVNTWYYFTYVYDGTNAKIYKNGQLLSTAQLQWNTLNNNDIFKLGIGVGGEVSFNGAIDDLKVYNYALQDTQISNLYNYNSLTAPQLPIVNTITKKPAAINATLYAELNGNGSAITSVVVKYGTISNALTSQQNAISISGNYFGAIINGLLENTIYYYKLEITNAEGTTTTTTDSFTTGTKQTIGEYSFDATYASLAANQLFVSNAGTGFTSDRNGNANAALNLTNGNTLAQITGLPIDGSTRTVSLWVKYNAVPNGAYPFSYGGILTDMAFACVNYSNALDFVSFSNGFSVPQTVPANEWNHFVFTYDGTTVRIYRNGTLIGSNAFNLFTAFDDNTFYLGSFTGSGTFNGAIDDLKIYNYPITAAEVTGLYVNNSLTNQNFENQSSLRVYPNPAQDVITIEGQYPIQMVEVSTLQGQLVLTSNQNQIDVSGLDSGMYIIKTVDAERNVFVNKVIVK